jgi:dihydropyrimidinase
VLDLIISGGEVVTEDGPRPLAVGVADGRIAALAPQIDLPALRRIDAAGSLVLPGLLDPHVHLSLPQKGTVSSDDPASGTAAALAGGVTGIIDFTLSRPGRRLCEGLTDKLDDYSGRAFCDYGFHLNLTNFPDGFERDFASQLEEARRLGARSVKVFTCYAREGMIIRPDQLELVLRVAKDLEMLVLVHAEDNRILENGLHRLTEAGHTAARYYPESRPPEAEAAAITAVVETARRTDSPVYFVHVSTAGGVQAIVKGRARSRRPIYLETCPQYLLLDDSAYQGPDGPQYLVAPPLRRREDREALLEALCLGQIDVVATDHCPFRRRQKDLPGASFSEIPCGLPGVETRLDLLHTLLVASGRAPLTRMVELLSSGPARIFGLHPRKGSIRTGADADLVLYDPSAVRTLDAGGLHMSTEFSPYAGLAVRGRVRTVLLRGQVAWDEGAPERPARGAYLFDRSETPR